MKSSPGEALGGSAVGTLGRPVRAVVYGVGAMGSIVTRLLVEKGAQLVGAVGRSPAKVGRDLGDVAGLGTQLGVLVSDDPSEVLASAEADVAVVAVASYLQPMFEHFKVCLENGTNVITIEEESFYPWSTAPELARRLDDARQAPWCHDHGLGGAGRLLDDTALGADGRRAPGRLGARPDQVERRRLRARGGPARPRRSTLEQFEAHVARHGWPSFVVRNTVDALVADAGLTPARGADVGRPGDRQRRRRRGRWAGDRPGMPARRNGQPPRSPRRRGRRLAFSRPAAYTGRAGEAT